ncbi:MAG TPA: ACT domain-containing protein, partial [Micropruina sp.]|nr:ACT domain-containing protein [Micropruina sp.]
SSFSTKPGTWVKDIEVKEGTAMEQPLITGVAHDRSESKITVVGVPDRVGAAAEVFTAVAEAGVNIDMIVQNQSIANDNTAITFTLPGGDKLTALDALHGARERIGFVDTLYDDAIGKVSVIGVGMRSHPGVSATFFRALAEAGINIQMISTSEIRISVVVALTDVDAAVRAAHTAFGLDSVTGEAVVYAGTGR